MAAGHFVVSFFYTGTFFRMINALKLILWFTFLFCLLLHYALENNNWLIEITHGIFCGIVSLIVAAIFSIVISLQVHSYCICI